MPTAQSIRSPDATQTYAAVIDNFRRAYSQNFNNTADELSDQEILLCWEEGWVASNGEEEDVWTLEAMRDKILDKPDVT